MKDFWEGFEKEAGLVREYAPAALIGGLAGGAIGVGKDAFHLYQERKALVEAAQAPFQNIPLATLNELQNTSDHSPKEWQRLRETSHELSRAKAMSDLAVLDKTKKQRLLLSALKGSAWGAGSFVGTAYQTRPK